jgi:hypothetical protein
MIGYRKWGEDIWEAFLSKFTSALHRFGLQNRNHLLTFSHTRHEMEHCNQRSMAVSPELMFSVQFGMALDQGQTTFFLQDRKRFSRGTGERFVMRRWSFISAT